ncbi:MAG: thymidylate synthase [Bacilli bacterium]
MNQYLELCQHILTHGQHKSDRTGTGTLSVFGYQSRYDLRDGFPLLTTKKVHFPAVVGELLWFLKGETNIRPLVLQNIRIWNEWPYQAYVRSSFYQGESMQDYIAKIKADEGFAAQFGNLGPVYGKQWRHFSGVDQVLEVERSLREDPMSRRHIISAWNPAELAQMALPPCHAFLQFYVSGDGKTLSCQLYQRSADVFLGVPFNIASYALLLTLYAETLGYEVGEFVHTLGDAHLYQDHLPQIHEQLQRTPRPLPHIQLIQKRQHVTDYQVQDIELVDYNPWPPIKGKVSV